MSNMTWNRKKWPEMIPEKGGLGITHDPNDCQDATASASVVSESVSSLGPAFFEALDERMVNR